MSTDHHTIECTQEDNIAHILRSLSRQEETLRDFVRVLQDVANHNARVDNLETRSTQHFNDLDGLFNRVRALEIESAKANTLFNVVSNKYVVMGIVGLAVIDVVGFVLDVTYHYETIKMLIKLI